MATKRPLIGLVVPSLANGGGVPSVARFIKDTAFRTRRYDIKTVSLSTSSSDPCSLNILHPRTWIRGAAAVDGTWEQLPFTHVGAIGGELEFQRYRSRKILANALRECDLLQVVCGSPAWANSVLGQGKPVSLQVATRARVERRMRDQRPYTVGGLWRKLMTEFTDGLDDRALRRVDAIQVENPWMLDYAKGLNVHRDVDIRYAPPGIDTDLFRPLGRRDPFRDPYVLCVARLNDPRKKISLLLNAYSKLPRDLIGTPD